MKSSVASMQRRTYRKVFSFRIVTAMQCSFKRREKSPFISKDAQRAISFSNDFAKISKYYQFIHSHFRTA